MGLFKIRDLIKEIQDGVELVFVAEENAFKKTLDILNGKGGELPIKIKIKIDEKDDR